MFNLSPTATILFLIAALAIFAIAFSVILYVWIYKDSSAHGQKGALWVVISVFTSPVLGWLIYYLAVRRQEFVVCHNCQKLILKKAQYCENCGSINGSENLPASKKTSYFRKFFFPSLVTFLLMLACLVSLIVYCFRNLDDLNGTPFASLNTGYVIGNMESKWDGTWTIHSQKSSDGYHHDASFQLNHPESEVLYADISCETGELTLYITQKEKEISYDVSHLSEPLRLPLSDFEKGKLYVRIERHGADSLNAQIRLE